MTFIYMTLSCVCLSVCYVMMIELPVSRYVEPICSKCCIMVPHVTIMIGRGNYIRVVNTLC